MENKLIEPIVPALNVGDLHLALIMAGHVPVGVPKIEGMKLAILEVAGIGRKIFRGISPYAPRRQAQTTAISRSTGVTDKWHHPHRMVGSFERPAISEGGGTGFRGPSRL